MRKILLIAGVTLALSCAQKPGPDTKSEELVFLAGYFGKAMVETPSGWEEKYQPNLSITLLLYSDNKCVVNAGLMEWPHKQEYDELVLRYRKEESGLVLYDRSSKIIFTIIADVNAFSDPETELANYLGGPVLIRWQESLGMVWDKYSALASWPMEMTLELTPADYDDVVQ